jgi:hypothetical protein
MVFEITTQMLYFTKLAALFTEHLPVNISSVLIIPEVVLYYQGYTH